MRRQNAQWKSLKPNKLHFQKSHTKSILITLFVTKGTTQNKLMLEEMTDNMSDTNRYWNVSENQAWGQIWNMSFVSHCYSSHSDKYNFTSQKLGYSGWSSHLPLTWLHLTSVVQTEASVISQNHSDSKECDGRMKYSTISENNFPCLSKFYTNTVISKLGHSWIVLRKIITKHTALCITVILLSCHNVYNFVD
jgi:hypothetical protein